MRTLANVTSRRRASVILCGLAWIWAMPAFAEDGGSHPIDSALEMMNLKTEAGPMPDFVTQGRGSAPAGTYIPVGAKPPVRSLKPKSAADVKALTAELDAAHDAQAAGKRPKPMSADAAGKPGKPVGKSLSSQAGSKARIP